MIGAHVPVEGALDHARTAGAEVVQVFLSNPQSWRKPSPRPDADLLRSSPLPIYVHAPYLVNPVADNNRVRIPSRRILQETCDAAAEIGAAGVVVHGGQVTGDGDFTEAFPRWRKALGQLDTQVPVLIENTAGGDNAVSRRIDTIRRLWEEIGDLGPGFVLDSCHAWAGGEPLEGIVDRVLAATGRLDLVHCNDSRDGFDSRRDRHASLGAGRIPAAQLVDLVASAGAPVVVETPGGPAEHAVDIAWLQERLAARPA